MAYTFAANTSEINSLMERLSETEETVKTEIDSIYSEDVKRIAEFWGGSSFDSFSDGLSNFNSALENLPKVIHVFENVFKESIGIADTCMKQIDDAIGKMGE